jgi:hypothetical protein
MLTGLGVDPQQLRPASLTVYGISVPGNLNSPMR